MELNQRRGVTLIELIFTIAISSVLIITTSYMLKGLNESTIRSRALSDMYLSSANALNQIAALMYDRVPGSIIGFKADNPSAFKPLTSFKPKDGDFPEVIEWIGSSHEAVKNGHVNTFVDLEDSDKTTKTIKSPGTNLNTYKPGEKYNGLTYPGMALGFSGAYDSDRDSDHDNNPFAYPYKSPPDADKRLLFQIQSISVSGSSSGDTSEIKLSDKPAKIYEKYYLADGSYAIALGKHVDLSGCNENIILNLWEELGDKEKEKALLLFFDYRSWKGQTFCGNKAHKNKRAGRVSILALDVDDLNLSMKNGLNFAVDANISLSKIPKGLNDTISITRSKVIF